MIKIFDPDSPEITEFRERIFVEDLKLPVNSLKSNNSNNSHKFAYWYSDQKFLNNGFDKILLYYHNDEPVGMCGGTHFNQHLYRGIQMYYILKSARKIRGVNTLHFKPNGFFDWQINRAKELNTEAIFIGFDLFDKKHHVMYYAMKNDLASPLHTKNEYRKYTAKDLIYLEEEFNINYVNQKICYFPLESNVNFKDLFFKGSIDD